MQETFLEAQEYSNQNVKSAKPQLWCSGPRGQSQHSLVGTSENWDRKWDGCRDRTRDQRRASGGEEAEAEGGPAGLQPWRGRRTALLNSDMESDFSIGENAVGRTQPKT